MQAKFYGGVLLPDGRVVFVPRSSAKVGLFDPSTNTFTNGANVGSGIQKFYGGVLLPDGRVVFVPYSSTTVGLFDPRTSATRKPEYTLSPGNSRVIRKTVQPNSKIPVNSFLFFMHALCAHAQICR